MVYPIRVEERLIIFPRISLNGFRGSKQTDVVLCEERGRHATDNYARYFYSSGFHCLVYQNL